jgi:hypothetical protein
MGSVASDVGNFVSDTVSSVGDIGQSVIDAGSDIVESVGSGVSDAAQSVSDAFAQIDPGPAIGDAGAAIDQVVNDVIPGGWYMVGAIAATIATAGTVNLEGEALAAGATGEVVAATTAAEAAAAGTAAAEGVAAASATTTAAASGSTAAQAALQSAATGALKGAAIGAAKSAIMGGDILDGAVNGALTGAIGGGVGSYASGLTAGTDLADYAKTVGAVAGGTAGGATGAALSGRDPLTGALIGGISGGTSSVASNLMPADVNPAITSAGLGAAKAAIMGGDPLTAALTSAGGSLLNQGVSAGYDAVKSGLTSLDQPTKVADAETQYAPLASNVTSDQPTPLVPGSGQGVSVTQAAFTSPFLLDAEGNLMYGSDGQPIPNPLLNQATLKEGVTATADRGSPLSQSQIDAANQLEEKLNSGEITQEQYDQQLSAIENQKSPIDAGVTDAVDKIYTGSGGLPTNTPNLPEGYSLQPPDSSDGMPRAYTTVMPPDGSTWAYNNTTGERISVPINGNTEPSTNTPPTTGTSPSTGTAGTSGDPVGKFLGDVAGGLGGILGGIFGGSGSGTGTGGTGGGSGSKGGTGGGGTGTTGYTTGNANPSYGQDVTAGLVNLTPGLTKPMDYDLAGLSHFATGGSTTSKTSSLFDDKGNYNYGNLSDTPLTAALTKHNVGYTLTGLPSKANGGLMQPMTGGGQFGVSGNFGTNDKVPTEHPTHQPQFFSEGGASLANRYVKGAGDGTSDSIPAMLANGEFVIPADVVSNLGNGSNDSGAKILDEFLRVIREHKTKHDARRLPPNSKGPLSYLTDAKRKVKK